MLNYYQIIIIFNLRWYPMEVREETVSSIPVQWKSQCLASSKQRIIETIKHVYDSFFPDIRMV